MTNTGHILVINPGSTSTKLAIFHYDLSEMKIACYQEAILDHSDIEGGLLDQLEHRYEAVESFLKSTTSDIQLIMARGAPLRPLEGGTYVVDQMMIDDLKSARYANHASNLAALIGNEIGQIHNIPTYITDPITTDDFEPLARISGVPDIVRKSRSHALNIKASLRKLCARMDLDFFESNWVVAHMGGGISIAAVKNGRIIDVNDALLGMGPFSPERAGALPLAGILDLVFDKKMRRKDIEHMLSKESGLKGYLGTSNLKNVEQRVKSGDQGAHLIFQAMVYQIAKEISAMASVHKFKMNGILLTGGMAHSSLLCNAISDRISALTQVYLEPGENEMESLAQAGLRVLLAIEPVKNYDLG